MAITKNENDLLEALREMVTSHTASGLGLIERRKEAIDRAVTCILSAEKRRDEQV